MFRHEYSDLKYRDLVSKHFESSGRNESYVQEIVRRMRLDGMDRFPTFAMENFPKHFGREVDYYIDHYTIISNRRGSDLIYRDENSELYHRKLGDKAVLELRDVNGETLSYRILFK